MGLRLYQAPVESDIQSKPSADKGPAQARSTIRRHRLGRRDDLRDQVRERRRRMLASAPAYYGAEQQPGNVPVPAPPGLDADPTDRTALLDLATRVGVLDDRVSALFNDQWTLPSAPNEDTQHNDSSQAARLRDRARSSSTSRERHDWRREQREMRRREFAELMQHHRDDDETTVFATRQRVPPFPVSDEAALRERTWLQRMAFPGAASSRFLVYNRRSAGPGTEPYVVSSLRTTMTNDDLVPSRSSTTSPVTTAPSVNPPTTTSRTELSRRSEQAINTESSRLDGLGDRNRSLSPEGDHVWHTLLTTLTPDPQPPSVGSSFASASVSAAGTQSTVPPMQPGIASSRTSFSTPEAAENASLFDQICDFISDTDEDHNDDDARSRFSQRWADVAARRRNNEENLDERVMSRIITRISRREPVPESWWAEVGLNGSISSGTGLRLTENEHS
ncbi:hypothetical protein QBC38DRAFT_486741 [Podospora fimiseda]|uniref:Uncharacterized protein n=1 Tax=Podospora fimiseda TaxID=252190 RepID=A0AAN7GT17_9PEZI|nr:hypothetical protein QBC38DRAFT_486741 [Podospora fimiseda]